MDTRGGSCPGDSGKRQLRPTYVIQRRIVLSAHRDSDRGQECQTRKTLPVFRFCEVQIGYVYKPIERYTINCLGTYIRQLVFVNTIFVVQIGHVTYQYVLITVMLNFNNTYLQLKNTLTKKE